MATYEVTDHPLLSDEAKALDGPVLEAQADAAERALGLAGTSFEGERETTAKLAVVYRINCQLRKVGEGGVITSKAKGDQRVEYSEEAQFGAPNPCEVAAQLAADLLREGQRIQAIRSAR